MCVFSLAVFSPSAPFSLLRLLLPPPSSPRPHGAMSTPFVDDCDRYVAGAEPGVFTGLTLRPTTNGNEHILAGAISPSGLASSPRAKQSKAKLS